MNTLYLFLLGLSLGFVAAIPVGASQIEMAKRAVIGHLVAAGLVVLGSVSSDILYGTVALFGIAPIMERPGVLATFDAVGACLLWVLAYFTYRESLKPHELRESRSLAQSGLRAYITGFTVSFSNPQMILSWLFGVSLAKRLGLASPFTVHGKLAFIAGGALGLGGYLVVLGLVVNRVKRLVPPKLIGRVYFYLAILLVVLSLYFVRGAVRYFIT